MRWIRAIVGTAALLLAVTACGEQTATNERPEQDPGVAPAAQELSRAPQDGPVPEEKIDASALPEGYPIDAMASDEGRTLTIVAQEGGCTKVSATLAEQTEERVTVTLVEAKPADENTMCTMDVRYPPLTVELDEPLGDRELVLEHEHTTY
ncbi:hypothetical protein [Saccharomonospora sp.]|uniref:hypothetical protein n=1 Tax=Saccharomonospora sp. TaxID=33913 RepID=UPI002611E821|nr:hypothetical protein [Saccharomonospora sp.]